MKTILTLFVLCVSFMGFSQKEFATISIGADTYAVSIDANIVASMPMGETVMLSATDGKGMSLTTMVAASVGEYEVTGGYTAPMLTFTKTVSDVYNLKSGKIIIDKVEGKTYTGSFEGEIQKTGEDKLMPASGRFVITLDM